MATRSLNVLIAADSSKLRKATREAEGDLDKLEQKSKRTGAELVASIGDSGPRIGARFKQGVAPLAGIAAAAGLAAGAALSKGVMERLDIEEANAKLKVQLGLNEKESARMGKLAGQLYAGNYGDSLSEVNDALKNVVQNVDGMSKASGSRLKGMTSDVISVAKAFDQDLGGTTRAVGQMMRTGLAKDSQEALNVITAGFQRGADKSEDFLDTLNEYGTQFRKVGLSGAAATGLISQGLQAGARDADIVADAVKEFSIRAVDGSETTAQGFKAIGLNAEDMAGKIGKGGETAAKGLDTTLDRLRKIKDPVERQAAAVALFGTQAEDLGDALFALDPSKAVDAIGKVGGAARNLNNELGDTAKGKIQTFWRTLTTGGTGALGGITERLGDAAGAATVFIKGMRDGSGAGGEFSKRVRAAVDNVKSAVSDWVHKNRADINSVVDAFKTVGRFAKDVFQDTVLPIVRRTMRAIGPIFDGVWHTIRGVVRLISGLFSGDWDKAWSGAKEAVSGAWKAIKNLTRTEAENLWEIIKDLGPKLVKALVRGMLNMDKAIAQGIVNGVRAAARAVPGLVADTLRALGRAITSGIKAGFGKLNPFGDGLGVPSGDGIGAMFPSFGGGLMGARPNMSPVAGAASRFGLHVSSGLRPGAITSSGNQSYHSSGEALDIAGPPASMLGFARFMKNTAGPRLAELIHTPMGAGVRNGSPFTYSGQVARDHYDHVHVAIDTGKPGVGDGIGQAVNAARAAGFRGTDLVNAVAIAGAESRYDADITNFKYPDHSIGLWQINQLAHKGRFGTDAQLMNPFTNAKAAYALFRARGGFGDWSTWPGGAQAYMAQARAAVTTGSGTRSRGGAGGVSTGARGGGGGSGGAAAPAAKPVPLTSPGAPGGYEQRIANVGLARAANEGNDKATIALIVKEGVAKGQRLAKVKAALKRRLTAATRKRLTDEATELVRDLDALSALMYDLTRGQSGISTEGIRGGTAEAAADIAAKDAKGEEKAPEPEPPATELDYLDAALAEAEATADTGDDLTARQNLLAYRQRALAAARATGDPRLIAQARRDLTSAENDVKALQDAVIDNTEAMKAHTAALEAVGAEMKRQTDFATSVQSTSEFQLTKTLADLVSGHIVGRGVAGRSFTPGTGVEVAYMYSAI